tara:strand:- start:666 stop:1178 length:513 start_codon:yes stop_codon:yes gene_type:complete
MPGHNSYLGSDRFIQNTYEQVLRDQGFTDDNNSGSVQDEEADFLKTLQRIKTKGDAGYYDMTPKQQQQYDQKNSSFNSGFKLIPPAPAAPGFLKNVVGGLTGDFGGNVGVSEMFDQSEKERLMRMKELNGTTFDNGDRSQGDQEAEQRMNQNKKTSLADRTAAFLNMFGK